MKAVFVSLTFEDWKISVLEQLLHHGHVNLFGTPKTEKNCLGFAYWSPHVYRRYDLTMPPLTYPGAFLVATNEVVEKLADVKMEPVKIEKVEVYSYSKSAPERILKTRPAITTWDKLFKLSKLAPEPYPEYYQLYTKRLESIIPGFLDRPDSSKILASEERSRAWATSALTEELLDENGMLFCVGGQILREDIYDRIKHWMPPHLFPTCKTEVRKGKGAR